MLADALGFRSSRPITSAFIVFDSGMSIVQLGLNDSHVGTKEILGTVADAERIPGRLEHVPLAIGQRVMLALRGILATTWIPMQLRTPNSARHSTNGTEQKCTRTRPKGAVDLLGLGKLLGLATRLLRLRLEL